VITTTLEPYSVREQVLGRHLTQGVIWRFGDFVGFTPFGEDTITQFPVSIHHCDQQDLVLQGVGLCELGFTVSHASTRFSAMRSMVTISASYEGQCFFSAALLSLRIALRKIRLARI